MKMSPALISAPSDPKLEELPYRDGWVCQIYPQSIKRRVRAPDFGVLHAGPVCDYTHRWWRSPHRIGHRRGDWRSLRRAGRICEHRRGKSTLGCLPSLGEHESNRIRSHGFIHHVRRNDPAEPDVSSSSRSAALCSACHRVYCQSRLDGCCDPPCVDERSPLLNAPPRQTAKHISAPVGHVSY
jgi:hypothetical protein